MGHIVRPLLSVVPVLVVCPVHRDREELPLSSGSLLQADLVPRTPTGKDSSHIRNGILLLAVERPPPLLDGPQKPEIGLALLPRALDALLVLLGVLVLGLVPHVLVPRDLVQVLELAELLVDGAADGALAGGELDGGDGRPVVFAELCGFCLLAVEGELLEAVMVL